MASGRILLEGANDLNYVYVAQLEGDTVVAVSMLKKAGFEQQANQVLIASLDESLLGRKYDVESEQFVVGGAE